MKNQIEVIVKSSKPLNNKKLKKVLLNTYLNVVMNTNIPLDKDKTERILRDVLSDDVQNPVKDFVNFLLNNGWKKTVMSFSFEKNNLEIVLDENSHEFTLNVGAVSLGMFPFKSLESNELLRYFITE